jgi:peroxiredoxin
MPKKLAFTLVLALVTAVAFASQSRAGKYNKVLSVGDAAPQWSGATGIDKKQHSLADYKDAKLIVQIFTCNHCPVAQLYEQRLMQLQKDYKDKGVQLVAISVSTLDADNLPAMKERAKTSGFNFPYLRDATQKVGRDYGATATPQVFVLDAHRKIVYMGGIDDSWAEPDKVTHRYLRDALDAALDGKPPAVTETKAKGCGIEYE